MPINRRRPGTPPAPPTTCLNWAGKAAAGSLPEGASLTPVEQVLPSSAEQALDLRSPRPGSDDGAGRLVCGDNLAAGVTLRHEGVRARLIYLDPPFESQADYAQTVLNSGNAPPIVRPAYSDSWPGGLDAYLDMLYPRLLLARQLLSDDGVLYVHLDWRTVHYVKLLLDEIFGRERFRNEIVWRRAPNLGRKAVSGQWGRVTESLLFYSVGSEFVFHRPVRQRPVDRRSLRIDPITQQGYKTAPAGDYTAASLAALGAEGRLHRTRTGKVRVRYNLSADAHGDWQEQVPVDSLWLDVPDMMHVSPSERTDYATQKPLALLGRIIAASSEPGDLVADLFCGSGTTLVAAEGLGRRWLGVDSSPVAVSVARARLIQAAARPFQIEATLNTLAMPQSLPLAALRLDSHALPDGSIEMQLHLQAPLDLAQIADWTVDWQFDGTLFRALWQSLRGFGKKPQTVQSLARAWVPSSWQGRIAVRLSDLQGVTQQVVLEV